MQLNHKTRSSVIKNLQKMFSRTLGDSITLEELFTAWGRNLNKSKENKAWLSNLLTHIKYHGLARPVYSFNQHPRRLIGLELTLEGKQELGRLKDTSKTDLQTVQSPTAATRASLEKVMDMVKELKEIYKDTYEITFDVKLKGF